MIKISGCQQQICALTSGEPFEKLLQNKDTEKFYCFCYTNCFCYFVFVILKSNKYLLQMSEDIATIIISKVTDRFLLKSKSGNESLPDLDKTGTTRELSEKEIHEACYITGYMPHKQFTKMKNSSK